MTPSPRILIHSLALVLVASAAVAGPGPERQGRFRSAEGRGEQRGRAWEAMLGRLDTSEDGAISKEEFVSKHGGFDRLDANDDGIVTEAELPVARDGRQRGEGILRKADADGDGRVTEAEWKAHRAKVFDRIDADHDGTIDKGEFMSAKPEGRQGTDRGR